MYPGIVVVGSIVYDRNVTKKEH